MTTVSTTNTQGASLIGTLGTSTSGTSADFNMFLKLLTTQMQNQDPLDPMDTSQYTQQLVQFSQVEQSMQQTSALKDILGRLAGQDMAQASQYIGREVTFDSAMTGLSAQPAEWSYAAARDTSSLVAQVTDSKGNVLFEKPLAAGDRTGLFSWDGTLTKGGKASEGAYTLTIKGTDSYGADVPVAVQGIGMVKNVTMNDGVVAVGINGVQVPMNLIVNVADKTA